MASEALRKEMQNATPRKEVFLPLLKTTFAMRRHYILHEAMSVRDILHDCPALKDASAVYRTLSFCTFYSLLLLSDFCIGWHNCKGLYTNMHLLQIEQEVELILSRPGILRPFLSEWRVKWVPAIMG